eukprot:1158481-Pelagomonas_calceolata.AAC.1
MFALLRRTAKANFYYMPSCVAVTAELVCEGLDAAVMKMKKGEKAEVTVRPPYSYPEGHAGKKAQPNSPNSIIKPLMLPARAIVRPVHARLDLISQA